MSLHDCILYERRFYTAVHMARGALARVHLIIIMTDIIIIIIMTDINIIIMTSP